MQALRAERGGGELRSLVAPAMHAAVAELAERVDALLADCADVLQRKADLEASAGALATLVRAVCHPYPTAVSPHPIPRRDTAALARRTQRVRRGRGG